MSKAFDEWWPTQRPIDNPTHKAYARLAWEAAVKRAAVLVFEAATGEHESGSPMVGAELDRVGEEISKLGGGS